MAQPKKVPVMVRLPVDVVARLDDAAEKDGRSRADVVRILIERALSPAPVGATATRQGLKPHADDCSCLSCVAPKAVAK